MGPCRFTSAIATAESGVNWQDQAGPHVMISAIMDRHLRFRVEDNDGDAGVVGWKIGHGYQGGASDAC